MNSQAPDTLFPYVFPFFFVGMWLAVTTLLGGMSGWFTLQREFPDSDEKSLLTLRGRSGRMGLGVNMGGILRLGSCPSGLRVGIWRVFGPFQRPFMVPWERIFAEPRKVFFMHSVRLSFGRPEIGNLTIDARLWHRLATQSGMPGLTADLPHVSAKRSALGFVLFWFAITLVTGTFFSFGTRSWSDAPSIAFCYGFPAVGFGVPTLIRFLRQRW